jgi:hypothetical protein
MRADDELHHRAETPNGRRPKKVQSRHGRFEALLEPRISLEATYGLRQLWGKEIVLGNVHSISRSQKNMVDGSFASVIELNSYPLAHGSSGNNRTAEVYGHVLEPRH